MQSIETIPGKWYAVTSASGCTVTFEAKGGTVTLEMKAPQDVFCAVGGSVSISDDSATLTQTFNLAPSFFKAARGWGQDPIWFKSLHAVLTRLLDGTQFEMVLSEQASQNKLIVHTDRVADDLLEQVRTTAEAYLPAGVELVQYNQSIDISWRDWSPEFVQLDYIDTDGNQLIRNAGIKLDTYSRFELLFRNECVGSYNTFYNAGNFYFSQQYERVWRYYYGSDKNFNYTFHYNTPEKGTINWLITEGPRCWLNDVLKDEYKDDSFYESIRNIELFPSITIGVYQVRISHAGVLQRNYIPALDPTGAPCLFDTVTRTPYYSDGSQDFLYPGKEEEPATYSLRRPVTYAQLTEHGVRRLYRVPAGYNGTKEEYAMEYGFKPLVETPQPEEGYWSPQWRETEEEIVLDWVETEAPAEQNDEISTTE